MVDGIGVFNREGEGGNYCRWVSGGVSSPSCEITLSVGAPVW